MTPDSIVQLRKAIRTCLCGNATLISRLGGPFVFDEPPRNQLPPYITFADVRSRDWSTSTDDGAEHIMTMDVWSRHNGVQEALEISALAAGVLETTVLSPVNHRVVSLQLQTVDTRREANGRLSRARQIFRIVTEEI